MTNTEQKAEGPKPPYISYTTLTNFIDKKLASGTVPPRIDKGFLDSYAGNVIPQLMGALRTIDLTDDIGTVSPALEEAATSIESRKSVFRNWATEFYAPQLELANRKATAQMLQESFASSGYTGSTLRKAIVFYLSLTEDVGLPKSPFFKAPRQTVPTKKRASPKTSQEQPTVTQAFRQAFGGETKRVNLGEAGSVTISLNVEWLKLPTKIFTSLREAIDKFDELAAEVNPVEGDDDA